LIHISPAFYIYLTQLKTNEIPCGKLLSAYKETFPFVIARSSSHGLTGGPLLRTSSWAQSNDKLHDKAIWH